MGNVYLLDSNYVILSGSIDRMISDLNEQDLSDRELIASTLTCDEPCTCCSKEEKTYLDPETRCAYCLGCLTIACEPEEEWNGEVDAEIVEIGKRLLAEMSLQRGATHDQ